jgi:hypothetical protein
MADVMGWIKDRSVAEDAARFVPNRTNLLKKSVISFKREAHRHNARDQSVSIASFWLRER